MLNFKTYKPQLLDRYIKSFDYYCEEKNSNSLVYSLLPIGTVQVLFQFYTDVCHKTIFTNGWQNRPNVFIAGPYDKGYEMKLAPSAEIFSVTFKPSMFKYFTAFSISDLRNQLIHPSQIWGKDSHCLIERVTQSENNYQRVAIIEKFLVKHFRQKDPSPVESAVAEVLTTHGKGRIERYAQLAGLSVSRFRTRFNEEVGVSPKEFQQLIRINSVSNFYKNNSSVMLTSLAYQFGYFDQSHFIKEFKSITGYSPQTYFLNRRFLQS